MSIEDRYFESKLVADGVWSIDGPANDLMYLVIGSDRAMLVDTGMGIGNLQGYVNQLTNLPIMVVNTHGHPDHAGGNPNFEEVWLSSKDVSVMRVMCTDEFRSNDLKALLAENRSALDNLVEGMVNFKPYKINPIEPGHIFDLGDRQFEVIEIPGHTPGSICLLNTVEKLIFTGDSIVATPVWLYLKHSLPFTTYYKGLKLIRGRQAEFTTLFPGHQPTPLGKIQLDDLISCAEEIINGVGIGELTRTFAGEGLLWTHGGAQMIYNPERLE